MEKKLFDQVEKIACKYAGLLEKRIDSALSGETESRDAMERINEGIRRLGYSAPAYGQATAAEDDLDDGELPF